MRLLSCESDNPVVSLNQGPLEPSEQLSNLEPARASGGGRADAAGLGGNNDRRELCPVPTTNNCPNLISSVSRPSLPRRRGPTKSPDYERWESR